MQRFLRSTFSIFLRYSILDPGLIVAYLTNDVGWGGHFCAHLALHERQTHLNFLSANLDFRMASYILYAFIDLYHGSMIFMGLLQNFSLFLASSTSYNVHYFGLGLHFLHSGQSMEASSCCTLRAVSSLAVVDWDCEVLVRINQ
jgi:hypothetical protein